jgi:hypothetical protein
MREETIQPLTTAQVSVLMPQMERKGEMIGGRRRLETVTAVQHRQIAKKAALAGGESKKQKPKLKA